MPVAISAFYAGLLALCYFYLSVLVIRGRLRGQVSLGDGGIDDLGRIVRAHGNFAEYVPLSLILLVCLEINSAYYILLHACAITLLLGRVLHAYGIRNHVGASWQRQWGMLMTFAALIVLAVANLTLIYWGKVG